MSSSSQDDARPDGLLQLIWARRWALLVAALLGSALGLASSFLIERSYEVSVVVIPDSTSTGSGALSNALGGLSALAPLVGLDAGMSDTRKIKALELLDSDQFLLDFILHNQIDQGLSSNLRLFDHLNPFFDTYTDADLVRRFRNEIMTVVDDKRRGVVKIAMHWTHPDKAAAWANQIVAEVNEDLRVKDRDRAEKSIGFLKQQLQQTNIIEMRSSVSSLIEAQLQQQMLASVNEDYALEVVAQASTIEGQRPVSPKRLLMGIAMGLLAAAGTLLIAFVRT